MLAGVRVGRNAMVGANAYAVAICPTITFAYRGGRVQGTSLSLLDAAALEQRIERLRQGP